jgi:hypothetical protein
LLHEGLKVPDYSKIVKVPPKTLENYLKKLKDAGLVSFKGAPKSGGYVITEKVKRKIKQ